MRRSLGTKIIVLFIVLAVISGIGTWSTYQNIKGMNDVANTMSSNYINILKNTDSIKINFANLKSNLSQLEIAADEDAKSSVTTGITQAEGNIATSLQVISDFSLSDREKDVADKLKKAYNDYQSEYDSVREQIVFGADNTALLEGLGGLEKELRIRINSVVFLNSAHIIDSQTDLENAGSQARGVFWTLVVALLIGVIGVVLITTLSIIRPTKIVQHRLSDIVQSIEDNQGDLSQPLPVLTKDEIGQLVFGVNKFIKVLQDIISKIKGSAGDLKSSVNEVFEDVNRSNEDIQNVSQSVKKLAESMDQVAINTDELNEDAKKVGKEMTYIVTEAKNGSDFASEIKQRASKLRAEGVESKRNTSAMADEIKEQLEKSLVKSKDVSKINDLTDDILDISEQTELLSLNASIEAARAGEAGKGFAVVADEIRKLAESSQNTANSIQVISNDVTESVESLARDANKMLEFIAGVVLPDYDRLVETGDQYSADADSFNQLLQTFADNAGQLQHMMGQMESVISGIYETVQESADDLSHVSTSTEQLTESMSQIQNNMGVTENISEQLEAEVAKFVRVEE